MAARTGRSPVFCKIISFAVTRSPIPMSSGSFSTSVFNRTLTCPFFATTCGARQTAVRPGWSNHPTEARAEATSSGSPSIRPTALDMDSSINQTTALTVAAAECNSNAPWMAESPGRLRSLFLAGLTWERSTSTPTATSLSVAKDSATLIVCAQAMRSSGVRHRPLTEPRPSTWGAASVPEE